MELTGREKNRKKKRRTSGFTLTETLMVVLLVSILSAAVAGGTVVVRNAYEKITLKANAQTVLSTTVTALEREFPYASDVSEDVENPSFVSGVSGARISFQSDPDSNIYIHYAADGLTDQPLLTEKTVTDELRTGLTYTYDGDRKLFDLHVTVYDRDSGKILAEYPEDAGHFYVRTLEG
jgi:prepilin-type N-terminal cleavage/methylation domain-containing protein